MRYTCLSAVIASLSIASWGVEPLTPLEQLLNQQRSPGTALYPVRGILNNDPGVKKAIIGAMDHGRLYAKAQADLPKQEGLIERTQRELGMVKLDRNEQEQARLLVRYDQSIADLVFFYSNRDIDEDALARERDYLQKRIQDLQGLSDEMSPEDLALQVESATLRFSGLQRITADNFEPSREIQNQIYNVYIPREYLIGELLKNPEALNFNIERENPSSPDLYKKLVQHSAAVGALMTSLGNNIKDNIVFGEATIFYSGQLALEHGLANRVIDSMRALKSTRPQSKLARVAELQTVLAKQQAEKDKIAATIDSERRLWNLSAYQSLSLAMTAVTKEINARKSANPNADDLSLRIAFMKLMQTLEDFEFRLATGPEKDLDPYPSIGLTNLYSNLQTKLSGGITDQPTPMELTIQFHLARHGRLGTLAWIKSYAELGKKFLNKLRHPRQTFNEGRELLTGTFLGALKNEQGEKGAASFAKSYPLLASEMAANLRLTYEELRDHQDESLAGELWNNAKGIVRVAETRNKVADLLLGRHSYFWSAQDIDAEPIAVDTLVLFNMTDWAPWVAGAYVGAKGKTTFASLLQKSVRSLPIVGPYLNAPVGIGAGVAEVYAKKRIAAKISRRTEVMASSFIRGIETFGLTGDPRDALWSIAKYQLAREVVRQVGDSAKSIREGTFWKDLLQDQGQCLKQNAGAVAVGVGVGTPAGAVVGMFLMLASAPATLPLTGAAAVAVGCGVAFAKAYDFLSGKKAQRAEDRKIAKLREIGERIDAAAGRQAEGAAESAKDALREAAEAAFKNDSFRKQLSKVAETKDQGEYFQNLWSIFEPEIARNLEHLDQEQSRRIVSQIPSVPSVGGEDASKAVSPSELIRVISEAAVNKFKNAEIQPGG